MLIEPVITAPWLRGWIVDGNPFFTSLHDQTNSAKKGMDDEEIVQGERNRVLSFRTP
jgi:hypothetical protein